MKIKNAKNNIIILLAAALNRAYCGVLANFVHTTIGGFCLENI
jgi:hypothetical protein